MFWYLIAYVIKKYIVNTFTETYGGDSGFNELSDESKSASISPDATNLMTTPSRIDSTSDDTGCP